ncbi:MBL fold metallo-hydrolase [Brevibacillus dissolubilis]|uniref:MBL fold metallo-hydrolase n=1 Tax=Brevibacillus dissolubilis TaxID=1844116 RepID=UPI001115FB5F|nr:MBL fold metallo-hydrolase [Brevibacillus dissolubilis]
MNNTYEVYQLRVQFAQIINYNYIIVDQATREAAIVDPAWDFGLITSRLEELGARLTAVLLTHSHEDHVNLAAPLAHKYNCNVYMSAQEIDAYGFTAPNLHAVQDEDVIWVGKTAVTCLVTPGHTPGGCCYLLSNSMFTGDTVFIEGCGICANEQAALSMYHSFQRIKRRVHPDVYIYPGHSFGQQPGHKLSYLYRCNIYFQLDDPNHFVSFRTRRNQQNLFSFK